jgi:hypothetical protein
MTDSGARQPGSAGGSGERLPLVFAGVVRALRVLLLTALALTSTLAPAGSAPSGAGGYRLAGVMRVGKDRIGFLEVPAGGQVLVRLGTVVDGGKVTVFDERELQIDFPSRTVRLPLTGGAGQPAGAERLGVVTGQHDDGHIMVRKVDPDRMIEALETAKPAAGTGTAKSSKPDAAVEVGRRFAAVANLPLNARVVAVNDKPVVSAAKAIAEVERTLAKGQGTTLNLESAPGDPPGRVYLIPERAGNGDMPR